MVEKSRVCFLLSACSFVIHDVVHCVCVFFVVNVVVVFVVCFFFFVVFVFVFFISFCTSMMCHKQKPKPTCLHVPMSLRRKDGE